MNSAQASQPGPDPSPGLRAKVLCVVPFGLGSGEGGDAQGSTTRSGRKREVESFVPGSKVQGAGFRVQGAGYRVQGAGFRVQGAGFRFQGSGFRVEGLGFRV